MVAGGDNALRSDFVGAARLLSIATHKKEMEVVHADRAGDDRLEAVAEFPVEVLADLVEGVFFHGEGRLVFDIHIAAGA